MQGIGAGLSINGLSRLILLQKYFHRIDLEIYFVVQHFWPSLSLPFLAIALLTFLHLFLLV